MTNKQWWIVGIGVSIVVAYYLYVKGSGSSAASDNPFLNPLGSSTSVLNGGANGYGDTLGAVYGSGGSI